MTDTHTIPSPAGMRAGRAIALAQSISLCYRSRSLTPLETAILVDLFTVDATVRATIPAEAVTVGYASTVHLHRKAILSCAHRHRAGAMRAPNRLLALV